MLKSLEKVKNMVQQDGEIQRILLPIWMKIIEIISFLQKQKELL